GRCGVCGGSPRRWECFFFWSSLCKFARSARLSLLRRIFTPVVSGTVIMLIAATVMPIVFSMLTDVPEGASSTAAIVTTLVTLVTVLALVLRAPPRWRLWSPIIGIAAGCAVAAPLGLYDAQGILDAAWVGVPLGAWPGFDLSPGAEFWGLLPAFIIVTLVGAIETIGDGVAIQRVSRRRPQATDFRVVQGALNADGMGNLLSGLAGTLPNTTYSSSIALAEVTGIGARRVGVIIGVIIGVLAFLPKVAAVLIAIPSPVAAAYITVLLGLLFVQGMKIVIQDGVDHRKAAVAGVAFWVGTGFQNQWIFAEQLGDGFLGVLLGNGMTSGALVAVIMMLFMELTSARRRRLTVALATESLPRLDEFLRGSAARAGWSDASTERLVLVGEETMASLLAEDGDRPESAGARRLVVTARTDHARSELEFVTGSEGENLEDRLAYMGEMPDIADEREISFRLLRHYASSVRHQKYHGEDIVTVSVAGSSGGTG
ncbi:MAG: purine/pyrimidine permease, partial [Chloroflexi bacterium]|nr:purine/pyrimidine permease [Chloroflexota bacterium]